MSNLSSLAKLPHFKVLVAAVVGYIVGFVFEHQLLLGKYWKEEQKSNESSFRRHIWFMLFAGLMYVLLSYYVASILYDEKDPYGIPEGVAYVLYSLLHLIIIFPMFDLVFVKKNLEKWLMQSLVFPSILISITIVLCAW